MQHDLVFGLGARATYCPDYGGGSGTVIRIREGDPQEGEPIIFTVRLDAPFTGTGADDLADPRIIGAYEHELTREEAPLSIRVRVNRLEECGDFLYTIEMWDSRIGYVNHSYEECSTLAEAADAVRALGYAVPDPRVYWNVPHPPEGTECDHPEYHNTSPTNEEN